MSSKSPHFLGREENNTLDPSLWITSISRVIGSPTVNSEDSICNDISNGGDWATTVSNPRNSINVEVPKTSIDRIWEVNAANGACRCFLFSRGVARHLIVNSNGSVGFIFRANS